MKKSFQTEMDDTQQAVSQIVCLCTTIALHQEFGVGKTRLDRITDRINELEDQNTEVIMTPDANGRPSKARAEAIRESWLAGYVTSDYRIPMLRAPRGRKEQQYQIAGNKAARIAWQIYAKAVIDILHYGPERLERLRKESHANYEQLNQWAHEDGLDVAMDMWDFSVIKDLLMNPVYTGAIASQKKDYRFKIGTIGEKKPEDWIVVEGQHEPLIDRMSFDIVQNKLKSRQRPGQTNEISLFAGLIKCGECGKSLTIRYTNAKHPQRIYSCKTYNAFGKNHCTQHRIDYDTLYSHVLRKIRECARAALMDGEAVADRLTNTCEAEQREQREAMERSLTRDEERIEVLDKMVMRLYEDMIAGRISEQNFNTMLEKTQTEQTELKTKVSEGRKRLSDEVQLANDAKQWVEAIQEYANITELDAATLNRLIKEIVVHERIDEDKTRHISIEIHFNLKPIPEVEQVTA